MKVLPLAALVFASMACAACSDTPTSPTSTTTTTTTVAEPSVTEEFAGALRVGGSSFYSFSVVENGTVNVTLTSVGGVTVPSTVWLGLGIGEPSGEDCAVASSVNTQSGAGPHLTGTYAPGVYCVRVSDIGNLVAPAQFAVSIAHP